MMFLNLGKARIKFAVSVLLVFLIQSSQAADFSSKVPSRENRLFLIKLVETHANLIVVASPKLKPSELEWIDSESAALDKLDPGAAGYISRLLRSHNSAELRHLRLNQTLTGIFDAMDCIKNPKVKLSREIYCWGVLAYHLSDTQHLSPDVVNELISAKRISPASEPNSSARKLNEHGRHVQEWIVVRYLRDQAQ